MFNDWFPAELLSAYLESDHKKRIDQAGTCLLRLKYRPVVVRQHLREWVRFVGYLRERRLALPSSFHEAEVQRYFDQRFPTGSPSRRRSIRASVRIFLDIDNDGRFARRVLPRPRATNVLFQRTIPDYLEFLRKHRGVSARTISKQTFQFTVLTDYLERIGISAWNDAQPSVLRTFLATQLSGRTPATRLSYASAFRSFLRWAYVQRVVDRDLSATVATARQYRLIGIPDLLTDDEVAAILGAVDRSTPLGKRDYAILLLAARYGMRPGDICRLSLDHISWRERQIALPQAKTGRLLVLPVLAEVADALIDYLRRGRPQTEFRNVFVRHLAPWEPFAPKNNLPTVFREALRRAGLEQRKGRKGIYLLRHTLASRLLRAGHSIKTIADVLGHVHLNSTLVYTKVDLSSLDTVTLSIEEMLQ